MSSLCLTVLLTRATWPRYLPLVATCRSPLRGHSSCMVSRWVWEGMEPVPQPPTLPPSLTMLGAGTRAQYSRW